MWNLDSKDDFDRYMLEYYKKIYPDGMMTVYNTHPEKQADGSVLMVANADTSWTEWGLPIIVALKTMMVSATKTLYENNWELYQHNYTPDGKVIQPMPVTPLTIETRLFNLEREVAILKSK